MNATLPSPASPLPPYLPADSMLWVVNRQETVVFAKMLAHLKHKVERNRTPLPCLSSLP